MKGITEMLEIILLILKIIGIVLLSILGLVVLIILLILFVPVRYRAQGEKHEEIKAEGRVTWLLHLLRIKVSYKDGKLKTKGKLLFFTIINSDEDVEEQIAEEEFAEEDIDDSLFPVELEADETEKAASTGDFNEKEEVKKESTETTKEEVTETKQEESEETKESPEKAAEKAEEKAAEKAEEKANEKTEEKAAEEDKTVIDADETEKKHQENDVTEKESTVEEKNPGHKVGKKKRKKDSKKETDEENEKKQGIVKKVKNLYNIKNDPRAKRFYALAKKRLKKIIRHILPRKLKGSVRVGTGDPCSTGKILGAAAMMYPLYGGNISVEPVFEEKALEFDLRLRGRIRIITVGLPLLRTYRNRDFKYLRKKIKKALK